MSITLSPAALARVQRYLSETPDALGLRFGVTRTGCSGWQHTADLAKDQREGGQKSAGHGQRLAPLVPAVDEDRQDDSARP